MPPLPLDVLLHIKAAECWLALGLPSEANREVEGIQPVSRAHEQVQRVCEKIRAATRTVARMIEEDIILDPKWDWEEIVSPHSQN